MSRAHRATISGVTRLAAAVALTSMAVLPAAADPALLARARALYNAQQYDEAIEIAAAARRSPETADRAAVVLARACLERYRRGADPTDLGTAREALGSVRADQLDAGDRLDFLIALGESLFLEDEFGGAAELFDSAAALAAAVRPEALDAALDWLGSAAERRAAALPPDRRVAAFARLRARMEAELARAPHSRAAAYWLVAALRGEEALDRAWDAAVAAWVRARLAGPAAAALRADVDRLVLAGLIPDVVRRLPADTRERRAAELRAEWELLKQRWR